MSIKLTKESGRQKQNEEENVENEVRRWELVYTRQ